MFGVASPSTGSEKHPPSSRPISTEPGQQTHEVLNQAQSLSNYNAFLCDPALIAGVAAHAGEWGYKTLERLGATVGSEEWQARANDANRHGPRLDTHDRFGHRCDAAAFHPAYHQLMQLGLESGAAALAWQPEQENRLGAHVVRGTVMYLMYQLDPGMCCPITMSFAATPALRQQRPEHDRGGFIADLVAGLQSCRYSGKDCPIWDKPGVTMGMSMTEKQGGSDVRANTTIATPAQAGREGPGDGFWLVGHKWFTSAPMSDAFLTLAKTKEGVSCFVVPRWLPGGARNIGFSVQRLKEKLGDKSNASSEVEYRNAWGVMLGEPGRGVRTILEMVVHTRLDCVIGSAALMRLSAQLAAQHASMRCAFGKRLLEQPLMRGVLADLALESEAAVATWLRLARGFDRAHAEESEAAFVRLATAIAKYYVCKRAPIVAYEAMECHGGNGYVEEGPMARLFRQSPLNAIWEGSGNVICLDVLRALAREPDSTRALLCELEAAVGPAEATEAACGRRSCYAKLVQALGEELRSSTALSLEPRARAFVDRLAVALQAAALLQHGDPLVAQAYLLARLPENDGGAALASHNFGALVAELPQELIGRLLERLPTGGGTPLPEMGPAAAAAAAAAASLDYES
eukprot:CAMPEP_0172832934 /NCGR_PEP_ID=MMETSP1075-20121228/23997_1 /TAXON_ID=2916 /ORGANISM="Ceratium fusus, Strain PA161109" /LENGTH=630 /DNA_ID=CAMNT_0013675605 /DNA_START=44 /DNA_END=1934 /DNA_ORIENTATION=+